MSLIHGDAEAYTRRLQMIGAAKSEILAEYYSFDQDDSGVTVMGALASAAQRGVQVRLIVDDITSKLSHSFLAALLDASKTSTGQQNLQIQVYNPFQLNLWTVNNRDHGKMLVVDRHEALVGGRNIGDKYFGLGGRNYLDLDVHVEGDVIADLVGNFFAVFGSKHVTGKAALYEFEPERLDEASCLVKENISDCDSKRLEALRKLQIDVGRLHFGQQRVNAEIQKYPRVIDKTYTGRQVQLLSHQPAKLVSPKNAVMTDELNFLMVQTSRELKIITPYLVLSPDQIEIFRTLIRQGKKVKIITNSMESGDDLNALTAYRKDRGMLRDLGIEVYEYKVADRTLHAKIIMIDDVGTMIGTYNFDPRSAYINREIGLYFQESAGDNPVMKEMVSFYDGLLAQSNKVIFDGKLEIDPHEDDQFSAKKKKLMKIINFALPVVRKMI